MIGIVVVSWGRAKLLRGTLESLFANSHYKPNVCIIDNGSEQATLDVIETYRPHFGHVCLLAKNEGKPSALNYGIEYFKKFPGINYFVLCDSDLHFKPDWDKKMLDTYKVFEALPPNVHKKKFGILSGFLFSNRGDRITEAGKQILTKSYPSGCCMMMSRQILEDNGNFKEKKDNGDEWLIKSIDTTYLSDMNHNGYYSGEVFPESAVDHTGVNDRTFNVQSGDTTYIK